MSTPHAEPQHCPRCPPSLPGPGPSGGSEAPEFPGSHRPPNWASDFLCTNAHAQSRPGQPLAELRAGTLGDSQPDLPLIRARGAEWSERAQRAWRGAQGRAVPRSASWPHPCRGQHPGSPRSPRASSAPFEPDAPPRCPRAFRAPRPGTPRARTACPPPLARSSAFGAKQARPSCPKDVCLHNSSNMEKPNCDQRVYNPSDRPMRPRALPNSERP